MTTTAAQPGVGVTAAADTAERAVVVAADSHVGPSMIEQLRPYCDQAHLDRFDEFVAALGGARLTTQMSVDDWDPAFTAVSVERSKVEGLQDVDARHRDMDVDGIAADVLHHGGLNGQAVPFFRFSIGTWGSADYDRYEPIGVHIYNRWLADFVSASPERHVGVAQISMRDFDAAVAEIRWAKDNGINAINLPAPRKDFPPYTSEEWEPFWATCSDLEITLVSHAGGGDLENRFTGPGTTSMYLMEMPWMGRRGVWHLIFGGVFERYPSLHYVLAEQYGDWIPATLKEMESAYEWAQNGAIRQALPLRPTEYFMRNVFVTASFMSREEARLGVEHGLVDRLLWGSDYPHPEGSYPHTSLSLRKTMSGLDRNVVDAYLAGNAAKAYRLDLSRLTDLANRIGPSYAELAEPYGGGRPADIPTSLAFREFGHYA